LSPVGSTVFGAISKPRVLLAADAPPEEVKEQFAVFLETGTVHPIERLIAVVAGAVFFDYRIGGAGIIG
jgi:hypothetical protein